MSFNRLIKFSCALPLLVSLAAVVLAEEKPRLPGIKGADDRQLIRVSTFPWSAIGRVNKRVGGFCTGTLIAPDRVLTAAHCLWNKRTQDWLPPSSLHFVAGYRQGDYAAESTVSEYDPAPGYQYSRKPALDQTARDWAVLTLSKSIGNEVGVLRLMDAAKPPPVGMQVIQAGYSQDKAHILTIHDGCSIVGWHLRGRLVLHDCDAVKGNSGSPILFSDSQGPKIIAIHVATLFTGGKALGVAVFEAAITAHVLRADHD